MLKVIDKSVNTVKELIDILSEIPGDYKLTPCDVADFAVAVDDENKDILIDSSRLIDETVKSINNDLEKED